MASIAPLNIFGATSAGQASRRSGHLIEFKAGKLHRDGTMVKPDTRKGLFFMKQSEDSLMHLCWKDRKTGTVEDDLIVFPDEAEWLPVKQCTTGRVFVLKFKTSAQRLFFWMQEPKDDKDAEYAKKINNLLNNPPAPGTGMSSELGSPQEQEQIMRMLAAQGLIPQEALSGLSRNSAASNASENQRESASGNQSTNLSSALTPELLLPIVNDESLRRRLFPHMPENHEHTAESLREVITSPQFRDAVQQLNVAIQSGEMGPLVQELGLDPAVVQGPGDRVLALLRAIRDQQQQNSNRMDES